MPTPISLAPVNQGGGLLASASPLGSVRWQNGLAFTTSQCLVPARSGVCDAEEFEPQSPSVIATFTPVTFRIDVSCSTLSGLDVENLSIEARNATREYAVAKELADGAFTGNPNLMGLAQAVSGFSNLAEAIRCLEAKAAAEIPGRETIIHVNPRLAYGIDHLSDGRTLFGSRVITSPGYAGLNDASGNPAIAITSTVWAATGFGDSNAVTERSQNTDIGYAEEAGIAVFDPCFGYLAGVTVTTCPEFEVVEDSPGDSEGESA